jgi:ferritin-like metal-binding protein YciE
MAAENKTLKDAFVEELSDAYDFEHQILAALPAVIDAAQNVELRAALESHLEETREQVTRLTRVFNLLGEPVTGKHCAGMAGILDEGKDVVDDDDFEPEAKDACLIAACQRVEHYEMAVYGTLVAWAQLLDLSEAEGLLQQTLEEEDAADQTLSDVAESEVNVEATER